MDNYLKKWTKSWSFLLKNLNAINYYGKNISIREIKENIYEIRK